MTVRVHKARWKKNSGWVWCAPWQRQPLIKRSLFWRDVTCKRCLKKKPL